MLGGDNEWGIITTLAELSRKIETLDDDLIIYAEANPAWSGNSAATVGPSNVDIEQLTKFKGMPYFLEVWLAKEVLEVWQDWRNGQVPTEQEALEALIYYATFDGYMPS